MDNPTFRSVGKLLASALLITTMATLVWMVAAPGKKLAAPSPEPAPAVVQPTVLHAVEAFESSPSPLAATAPIPVSAETDRR